MLGAYGVGDSRASPPTIIHRVGSCKIGSALLALALIGATGCGMDRLPVKPGTLVQIKAAYDEAMIEREPLCIEAGPFPFRGGSGHGRCDRCQDLAQAGLLTRKVVDNESGGYVEYSLSDTGTSLYRFEPDPEYLDLLRARFAKQGQNREPDAAALSRPRLCLGQTRFHSVAEALAPFMMAGTTYLSVKLVAEAKDTSGLLFDPNIATLGLPIPPKPEAAKPLLYAPRVVTFAFYQGDPSAELSDVRYGAWVNEP
jgi:hypothetical protein